MDESNLTDSFASAKGDCIYEDSDNSQGYSEASYPFQNDTPLQEDSWDADYDDSYYDLTYASEDEKLDIAPTVMATVTEMEHESNVERTTEMQDEALEENNNDPNNNMDSNEIDVMEIQTNEIRNSPVEISDSDEVTLLSPMNFQRSLSPKPGCSKDCVSLPDEKSKDEILLERTRYILTLISQIHRDSIFDALTKNNETPVSQLKLWDLIPDNARLEYPDDIIGSTIHNNVKKDFTLGSICPTIKRGPDEDICTIGCKRSSSTPDISNSEPMTTNNSIPKVASSSQIAKVSIKPSGKPANVQNASNLLKNTSTTTTKNSSTMASKKSSTITTKNSSTTATSTSIPVAQVKLKAYAKSKTVYGNHGAIPKVYGDQGTFGKQRKEKTLPVCQTLSQVKHSSKGPVGNPATVGFQKTTIGGVSGNSMRGNVMQSSLPVRLNTTVAGQQLPIDSVGNPGMFGLQKITVEGASGNSMQQLPQSSGPVRTNPTVSGQQLPKVDRAAFVKKQIDEMAHWNRVRPENQKQQPETHQQMNVMVSPSSNIENDLSIRPVIQQIEEMTPSISQTPKRVICMEIYYKLINIFPNIEREYIKDLCSIDCEPADRDGQLSILIEHILERGDTVPRIIINDNLDADDSNVRLSTVDEIYENLLGIFPDADPHFLRESAESKFGKPNELKTFVETQLERRDYPTREEYMARLKITEQQRQYTEGFDLKQYLSIIPDPVKQFMDANRKCKHSTVAFEFLKSHFNRMRVTTISRHYTDSLYNLSRTATALEAIGSELKSKRCYAEMLTADILLLQEIAFIKHKKQIIAYLDNLKRTEDAEFERLKAQKLLLECQCCYDEECVPSKCSTCDNGHIFCNNCVISGTSAKMGDGETRINCFVNCGSEFRLSVLQRALAPTTFSILLKKRQAAEVIEAGLEGLVSCPFCHFASIPPEGDKIFKCLNPECTKESCRLCKELSHVPLKCDEVMKAEKARHFIEEKMTEALARKCYKCQKSFFKEEGCNKITCVCGAMMCYLCDEPIKDYSHFRGQGSDDKNRCPLYSDTIRLDAVAVRKIAEKAQLEVMKMNPNLKIDTAGLLPDVPRARSGPHQNVIDADELPRRAQRALGQPPV